VSFAHWDQSRRSAGSRPRPARSNSSISAWKIGNSGQDAAALTGLVGPRFLRIPSNYEREHKGKPVAGAPDAGIELVLEVGWDSELAHRGLVYLTTSPTFLKVFPHTFHYTMTNRARDDAAARVAPSQHGGKLPDDTVAPPGARGLTSGMLTPLPQARSLRADPASNHKEKR
jgi:hypothetical protein